MTEQTESPANWTGARFTIALLLAILMGLLFAMVLVMRGVFRRPSKLAILPLTARLLAKSPQNLRGPVLVEFELLNEGRQAIPVADRDSSINGRRDEYDVVVTDSIGRVMDDPRATNEFKASIKMGPPPRVIALQPGQSKRWTLDLKKFARFAGPGRYKVEVSRSPFADKIRARAPPIYIELR